jgi:putative transposase
MRSAPNSALSWSSSTEKPTTCTYLVAYPRTLAISTLMQRLKGRTDYTVRREYTVAVCARTGANRWSLPNFAVPCRGAPLSIIKQ